MYHIATSKIVILDSYEESYVSSEVETVESSSDSYVESYILSDVETVEYSTYSYVDSNISSAVGNEGSSNEEISCKELKGVEFGVSINVWYGVLNGVLYKVLYGVLNNVLIGES